MMALKGCSVGTLVTSVGESVKAAKDLQEIVWKLGF